MSIVLLPDPGIMMTSLDWEAAQRNPHLNVYEWYRRILALRSAEIVPRLGRNVARQRAGPVVASDTAFVRLSWAAAFFSGPVLFPAHVRIKQIPDRARQRFAVFHIDLG